MRCQNRHDHGAGKKGSDPLGGDAGRAGAGESMRNRALARRCSAERVSAGPADVVLVLGDIGEMRKKAEGANNLNASLRRQAVQRRFEVAAAPSDPRPAGSGPSFAECFRQCRRPLRRSARVSCRQESGRAAGCLREASGPCLRYRWSAVPPSDSPPASQRSRCPLQKPCRSAMGPPPHPLACFVHIKGLHRRT